MRRVALSFTSVSSLSIDQPEATLHGSSATLFVFVRHALPVPMTYKLLPLFTFTLKAPEIFLFLFKNHHFEMCLLRYGSYIRPENLNKKNYNNPLVRFSNRPILKSCFCGATQNISQASLIRRKKKEREITQPELLKKGTITFILFFSLHFSQGT